MNLYAPAKTFLIGEYVATAGGPAIVLATQPFFSLSMDETVSGLVNIHIESPAGRWYRRQSVKPSGLIFTDPYQGGGGMGASSAQFVLVYQAVHHFQRQVFQNKSLLADYYQSAWHGKGIHPSGYDVLTQYAKHTMFIDNYGAKQLALNWPFPEINLLLVHTNNKLATHIHLARQKQPNINLLQSESYNALASWEKKDAAGMIEAINIYYKYLNQQQLVAPHTTKLVSQFMSLNGVLAAKGCGAMGADVVLFVVKKEQSNNIKHTIKKQGLTVLTEITA